MPQILLVEDDQSVQTLLMQTLRAEGWTVNAVTTGEAALRELTTHPLDLLLTDLQLPDFDGVALLEKALAQVPSLSAIVMTGYGTVERAVEAMRAGAVDFIRKPFDMSALVAAVRRVLDSRRKAAHTEAPAAASRAAADEPGLVGVSAAMRTVLEFVRKVADSDSTVLITGESGTGKEVLARALHAHSRRARGPWVPVNCGAIPEALLESELFGHERGAFTGAQQARAGRFEMAHGGTLFLDEIGEMPLALQVKLLRALQERSFERVGGTRAIKVDVRIVAATNADLEAAVKAGRFRKDLYYRLQVIPVEVPPLRQRRDDIPVLIQHFIQQLNARKAAAVAGIDAPAMARLCQHDWPGNVRELENLIERLVVLKRDGTIAMEDLPERLQAARLAEPSAAALPTTLTQQGIDLMSALEQYENQLIIEALNQAGGVTSKAARLLRLNRTTLVEKLKRKKLDARGVAASVDATSVAPPPLDDEPSIV
ncbi:MAG: sigma-54 dependent transcriptional regulator [Nitrospiraceae bacterium]